MTRKAFDNDSSVRDVRVECFQYYLKGDSDEKIIFSFLLLTVFSSAVLLWKKIIRYSVLLVIFMGSKKSFWLE